MLAIGYLVDGRGRRRRRLQRRSSLPRRVWISALDKIESLNPRAVIAGHKRPENDNSPRIVEETRQYIRDFDRLA